MKTKISIILGFIIMCGCSHNSKKMQKIIVFDDYTVNLPLEAKLYKENTWIIESGSSFATIAITRVNNIWNEERSQYCEKLVELYNRIRKNNFQFVSEKEIESEHFYTYIANYSEDITKGAIPQIAYCRFVVFDEKNTSNRILFETNSLGSYNDIADSISSSFKRIILVENSL